MSAAPRFLYLHGFASGPDSKKGVTLAEHYARRGVELIRLNLRIPTFSQLRFSAMLQATQAAIGGPADRAVVFGSSLGGLTAAEVAARDARVAALVLLAPAFFVLERWPERLGAAAWQRWQQTGWQETMDYTTGRPAQVDWGFITDLEAHCTPGLPDVRVPTLILHGRRDEVVDIDAARRFAAGKRHVRLIELDDGHELVASLPRIAAAADEFLRPFIGGTSPAA